MLTQPILLGALTGLASSAHCAAMCGPLAASVCKGGATHAELARYQVGRAVGYTFAGALAGGLGSVLAVTSLAPWLGYALPVATALSLLVLARRVLQPARLVALRTRSSKPRASWFARLSRLAPRDPSAVGVLTALLPCAALGTALLLAASTQTRGGGALLMLGFSTTTALGVLGGGALLGRLAKLGGRVAPRALAVALACAALYVGLRPVYAHVREPGTGRTPHAPSCH